MNKLVFFDIDGILIADKSGNNVCSLIGRIEGFKKGGIIFGINTNRPLSTAAPVYKKFHLNGPLILENGALIKRKLQSRGLILNNAAKNLNSRMIRFLVNLNISPFNKNLLVSDDKSVLRRNCGADLSVLISRSRKFTSSIYIRSRGRISLDWTKKIHDIIEKKFLKCYETAQIIPEEGKIIVANNVSDRTLAMRHIQDKLFPNHKLFIISDDEKIKFRRRITFCAVESSAKRYFKDADVSCKIGGVRGVNKILDIIYKNEY